MSSTDPALSTGGAVSTSTRHDVTVPMATALIVSMSGTPRRSPVDPSATSPAVSR